MASLSCAVLFLVLVSLAAVQYRWIAELREAERRQLELSLKTTASRFAQDFVSELLRVVTAFQLEYRSRVESLSDQLKDATEQWQGSATYPGLILELLIIRRDDADLKAYRFDPSSGSVNPIPWHDSLAPLKIQLTAHGRSSATLKSGSRATNPIFLEAGPA
jgi:hypothetical protein